MQARASTTNVSSQQSQRNQTPRIICPMNVLRDTHAPKYYPTLCIAVRPRYFAYSQRVHPTVA